MIHLCTCFHVYFFITWATCFHGLKLHIDFDKKKTGWATLWATFFTNSSGHPASESVSARPGTVAEKKLMTFSLQVSSAVVPLHFKLNQSQFSRPPTKLIFFLH
jgi:hypothetical protein